MHKPTLITKTIRIKCVTRKAPVIQTEAKEKEINYRGIVLTLRRGIPHNAS